MLPYRFQQPVQLQLTGWRWRWRWRQQQPGLRHQPLSVQQPSGLRQGRRQHELPVQIDSIAPSSTLRQCLKPSPKKVIDGLPVLSAFFHVCFFCAFGFICSTCGHKLSCLDFVKVGAELRLNLVVVSVVWSVLSLCF